MRSPAQIAARCVAVGKRDANRRLRLLAELVRNISDSAAVVPAAGVQPPALRAEEAERLVRRARGVGACRPRVGRSAAVRGGLDRRRTGPAVLRVAAAGAARSLGIPRPHEHGRLSGASAADGRLRDFGQAHVCGAIRRCGDLVRVGRGVDVLAGVYRRGAEG